MSVVFADVSNVQRAHVLAHKLFMIVERAKRLLSANNKAELNLRYTRPSVSMQVPCLAFLFGQAFEQCKTWTAKQTGLTLTRHEPQPWNPILFLSVARKLWLFQSFCKMHPCICGLIPPILSNMWFCFPLTFQSCTGKFQHLNKFQRHHHNTQQGPIHRGCGAPRNTCTQIMEHAVANGSVHTGCNQHQKVCTQVWAQIC